MYYANPTGTQRVVDSNGFLTPDIETIYSDTTEIKANYSASVGQDTIQIFGNATNYSRVIAMTECPFVENTKVWIGIEPTEKANYKVVKIADSLNHYLIALQEVI